MADLPRSIRDVLERAVALNSDKVYLLFEDQQITYRELDQRANRAANAFLSLGLRKGQRVALMLPNRPEFLYLWLGLSKIGGSMVPLNTAFRAREAQYVIDHSEARFLVADGRYADVLRPILPECPRLERALALGGATDAFATWEPLFEEATEELAPVPLDEDDEASVLYTSGTTGYPKGCVQPHSYYLVGGQVYRRALGLTVTDRVLTPLPLFHMNPQILSTMGTLLSGGSLVLVDRFHPTRWWDEVRRTRPTVFHYLGVMPAMLMGLPVRADDRAQPARLGVGAGVGADVQAPFEERFGCKLLEVFGMTEVGLNFCCPPMGERKVGTRCFCRVFPEYEALVVDEQDLQLPPGTPGELLLRGSDPRNRRRGFMREYLKNPQATADAWQGDWFHTGDTVVEDGDGYFHFLDRQKDMIRRSGENISSAEVEAVVRAHPQVLDVAVIPVPDPIREEEVKACVILRPGESAESCPPETILTWCDERLAYFKVPRYLEYRESFPRTPTEKIQKQLLRAERDDPTAGCYDRLRSRQGGRG